MTEEEQKLMIKSDKLMALEKAGVVYQSDYGSTKGQWFNGFREHIDLTPYLLKAGMFEH